MALLLGVLATVVGALCLLNLLLTVGVIRRLKEHTALIESMNAPPPAMVLSPGERIGDFTAETEDGVRVSSDTLATELLVAVFSPGCSACTEQLPRFVGAARTATGGRDHVIAVVAGAREEYAEEIDRLSVVARVFVPNCGNTHYGGRVAPVTWDAGCTGTPELLRTRWFSWGRRAAIGYPSSYDGPR
jgi:hypothetical protein